MLKNEAQEEVIHNVYGQTIVIACPGSGKTTTLLRRINYMIKDEHINPSEIVMITFTKAAADETECMYSTKQYTLVFPIIFSKPFSHFICCCFCESNHYNF